MLRVLTTLHLPVAYINDITRPIAICNNTHKFATYPYSTLQEFAVDNTVMVTSCCETVRKLHAWRKDFDRALKRIASIACELDSPCDPGISSVFSKDDVPWFTLCLDRAAIFHSRPVTETSSTSTTMESTWRTNDAATTTTLARLRCFMRRVFTRPG